MEFDLLSFIQAAYPVVGLGAGITIALGTLIGKLGAEGKLQLGLTMLAGLLIGFFGIAAQLGIPNTLAYWFGDVVIGLMTGLTAVGVYETGVHLAEKAKVK